MLGEVLDHPLVEILHIGDGVHEAALPQHVGILGKQGWAKYREVFFLNCCWWPETSG